MKEHQCAENVQSHREALPGIMTQLPHRDQQLSKASQTLSRKRRVLPARYSDCRRWLMQLKPAHGSRAQTR